MNIVWSLAVHAAIITTAFTVGRGWTLPAPADFLTVSLVSGVSEIKVFDGQDQKKQVIHSPSPARDTAVSNPPDYGSAVKDKTSAEADRDASQIILPEGASKAEERSPREPVGATVGLSGPQNTRGVPSPTLAVGHQDMPAGNTASGAPGHDQAKTLTKDANTEDGKAIRKAIEKALIYPLFARKRRWEGTALSEFTINVKGYPEEIRVIGSSGYDILDTAAKEALIKAAPFIVGKGRYEIPITFRLKNN